MSFGSPEMDAVLLVLLVVELAMVLGMLAYMQRATRSLDTRSHLAAVEATLTKAVAELRLRAERHEQQLAQAPSGQQFADVRVQLAALEGRQEAVFNEAHGARAAIRRVEDFLLKAGRHETQY